jgi:hypothetical protein
MEDILTAVRERSISAATAAEWLEMRLAEAKRARQVRAHATPAMRDRLVRALDGALAGGGDEFGHLFPPHDPLGPAPDMQDQPLVHGPPDSRGNRRTSRKYAAAGEMADEEADSLFAPATSEEADHRARVVRARSERVEDLPDEELHRLLFGDTTGEGGA